MHHLIETFAKCIFLFEFKPPICRAYAPEGKAIILTTGIHGTIILIYPLIKPYFTQPIFRFIIIQ
jgi:hypothetical protein